VNPRFFFPKKAKFVSKKPTLTKMAPFGLMDTIWIYMGLCSFAETGSASPSWSDAHDTTPLEQICDHVNSLEEEFPEQQDEEVRHQFKALVEQCRSALDKEEGN
jgi:hypothetical protein